jgi:hypothetical protein
MDIITAKIDVRRIDKSRLFEGKENREGHKPLYLDVVLLPLREVGKFGDTHIIKQSKKKGEEVELPIIGNATQRGTNSPSPTPKPAPSMHTEWSDAQADDIPF